MNTGLEDRHARALAIVQAMLDQGARFVDLDGKAAPRAEVVSALLQASELDIAQISELTTEGRVAEVFPYRVECVGPSGLREWDSVTPAPTRALTDDEYLQMLAGRIPSSLTK